MAAGHDSLRTTLDTLHLDPQAGADRPYLISMLRRLGYSETEIREIITDYEGPATGGAARDIEVEYTGAGLRDYVRVIPSELPSGFDLNRPGELVEFASADTKFEVLDPQEMVEFAPSQEEELMEFAVPVEEAWQPEGQAAEAAPVQSEATPQTSFDLQEAPKEGGWEPASEESQAAAEWQPAEGDAPYQYGEWTLYRRPASRQDGGEAPVYFFAKDTPRNGEPSAKPEGYEVGVNDRTGLPFLRRGRDLPAGVEEVDPQELPQAARRGVERISGGRRRVRVLRVRAASREEAERMLASQERQVLGSVPIDIQEHWGEP